MPRYPEEAISRTPKEDSLVFQEGDAEEVAQAGAELWWGAWILSRAVGAAGRKNGTTRRQQAPQPSPSDEGICARGSKQHGLSLACTEGSSPPAALDCIGCCDSVDLEAVVKRALEDAAALARLDVDHHLCKAAAR